VKLLRNKKLLIPILTFFLILFVDQIIKIYIKTHYYLGESRPVFGSWFLLTYIENNGMAFGMEFAGKTGKILLSLFRIVFVGVLSYYLYTLIKKKANMLLLIVVALIIAGAFGNIIDCAFYGITFNESTPFQISTMFPPEGGYTTFLQGRVVDMLYFPIINTHYPSWFPIWGGQELLFFAPVFNIADSSITIGIFIFLIFQKKMFKTTVASTSSATGTSST